VAVKNLKTVR